MSKIEVGDVFQKNEGGSVKVLDYINCQKIHIQHQDEYGHKTFVATKELRKGAIKNPFYLSVCGVGYVGIGPYKPTTQGKRTPAYKTWSSMMTRAYCKIYKKSQPTYDGCSVADIWHNFQNFAEWFYNQPNSTTVGFDLDKDLLFFGNKQYSQETCTFAPHAINSLLIDSAAIRGDLPIGVKKLKDKFQARVKKYGKLEHIGTFDTPEEAYDAYKKEKQQHVKLLAEHYKNDLHPEVYKNLMSWGC